MRLLILILLIAVLSGCGNSAKEETAEPETMVEEVEITDEPEESQTHKEPDGAFGAKDFATEAKGMSDRSTRTVEEAASQEDPAEENQ